MIRLVPIKLLLYILILHQTTTRPRYLCTIKCCFISWFYIKPQRNALWDFQTVSCFISWFYIKPQHIKCPCKMCVVALYLDSTSNHNYTVDIKQPNSLLYILILHQTTTTTLITLFFQMLLYILILHQTTTNFRVPPTFNSCFISWFYIKPQRSPHSDST